MRASLFLMLVAVVGCNSAQGPQGPQGPKGDLGPPGPAGERGAPGAVGMEGPQGPQGPQGPAGASGLVTALDAGSTGCPTGGVALALADGGAAYVCNGLAGPQGAAGVQGPAGATGPQGDAGPAGPQGASGPQGPTGAMGPAGPAGPAGPTGATGATGAAGPTGATGAQGPAGTSVVGSTEPAGANCTYGGSRFVTGAATTFACTGAPGAAGPTYSAGAGLGLTGTTFSAAFTTAGGDNGSAVTVARGDHLHDARYALKPFTTVVVSPTGTPIQNGNALRAAIAGITDNSATKRYVVKLEPGTYDMGTQPYFGKPFVDLEGSGRGVTVVVGNAEFTSTVNMENPSEVRELTVSHTGGVGTATALWLNSAGGATVAARRVNVSSTGGSTRTTGVLVGSGGLAAVLDDVEATVSGPAGSFGFDAQTPITILRARISVTGGSPTVGIGGPASLIDDVRVTATGSGATYVWSAGGGVMTARNLVGTSNSSGASSPAYGVNTAASSLLLEGCSISAVTSGGIAFGLSHNQGTGTLTIRDSHFRALGASSAFGATFSHASATIEGGSFSAEGTSPGGQAFALFVTSPSWLFHGVTLSATALARADGLSLSRTTPPAMLGRFDNGRIDANSAVGSNYFVAATSSGGAAVTAYVGNSIVRGSYSAGAGTTVSCAGVFGFNNAAVTCP